VIEIVDGVALKGLTPHHDERGVLCEVLRRDWPIFRKFAMTYFSVSYPGVIRAWHRHRRGQIDYFVIIRGAVRVVVYDQRKDSPSFGTINEFVLSEENPILLRVPGECWHGYKVIGKKPAILLNFPTKLYDYERPDEDRLPPDSPEVPYTWA